MNTKNYTRTVKIVVEDTAPDGSVKRSEIPVSIKQLADPIIRSAADLTTGANMFEVSMLDLNDKIAPIIAEQVFGKDKVSTTATETKVLKKSPRPIANR